MTRLETASRPWEYSVHATVDEVDLTSWPRWRLAALQTGVVLLRLAVVGLNDASPETGPTRNLGGKGVSQG